MLFDVTIYYLLAVGSNLPGLRLAVGFVGVQSFPETSRFHQLGAVSVPGAVHGWFVVINNRSCLRLQ
jgi:hypothetical protein